MTQCVRKYGVVGTVLWACPSKRGEFRRFIGKVRVSRVSRLSKIRVGIRDSIH